MCWKPFSPFLFPLTKKSSVLTVILGQAHSGLLLRVKVSQVGCPGVPHRSQYLRPKDYDSELHCRAAVWNAGKSP